MERPPVTGFMNAASCDGGGGRPPIHKTVAAGAGIRDVVCPPPAPLPDPPRPGAAQRGRAPLPPPISAASASDRPRRAPRDPRSGREAAAARACAPSLRCPGAPHPGGAAPPSRGFL